MRILTNLLEDIGSRAAVEALHCRLWLQGVLVDLVSVVQGLNLSTAASDSLELFYLEDTAAVRRSDIFFCALAVLFEVFVHVQEQLLDLLAGECVLLVEARANAEVERLFGLLLLGPLFKARSLASQSELDHFAHLGHVLLTLGDNALHVAAFSSNEASCHLELALIWDLNIVAASVFSRAVRVPRPGRTQLAAVIRMHTSAGCRLEHYTVCYHGL
mmetsp:Transcript_7474/g.10604  ORF Transcript_7474/g.10604 Transcript_7474/m.10604 type:complete len:216 (+) Transcript_7474:651-1298(+)|eukprot:CAMPEP_0185568016 /NCGR_PEP_ID=MMETSP0434-20130131/1105_1 /TAXON_ID=626734 ORGANISM="Favella taraikaensis, Strain Fe Narragansett Bay" /NCGR_SAMPLE_ID=MMETSP0434 /ASSEMBLY_ACC=CAM_ASM_000379 /LENGTH=215 /DNA_ID=CAMNT_0028182395 /DNA_START=565 /DNA_END=1212 /DNA_ORIENTATION=-